MVKNKTIEEDKKEEITPKPDVNAPVSYNTYEKRTPEGKRQYTVNGKTFELSEEEYKGVYNQGGGVVTPQVTAIQQAQSVAKEISERRRLKELYKNTLERTGDINAFITELGKGEPALPVPTSEEVVQNAEVQKEEFKKSRFEQQKESLQAGIENPMGELKRTGQAVGALGKKIVTPVAVAVDIIQSAFKGGKRIKEQAIGEILEKTEADIKENVQGIMGGYIEPSDAKIKVQQFEEANNLLEEYSKVEGKINLKYFLDDGISIQTRVRNNKDNIKDYYRQIAILEERRNQQQLLQFYGTQNTVV